VKLLFDQNVSPDLVRRLADLFPGSEHVFNLELHEVDDGAICANRGILLLFAKRT
jgi:predicted nuclease of predicted toxin-antitoxin system